MTGRATAQAVDPWDPGTSRSVGLLVSLDRALLAFTEVLDVAVVPPPIGDGKGGPPPKWLTDLYWRTP